MGRTTPPAHEIPEDKEMTDEAGAPVPSGDTAQVPQLTTEQFARLTAYGVTQEVRRQDVVFRPGDPAYDLIVIESGWIEIVSPPSRDEPEAVVAAYGSGGFLGELNLLTGQTAYLTARVTEAGRICRISHERFRQLMADDPEISDVLLRTFLARRDRLRDSTAARGIEIVGSGISADALALRTYAARQRLPHLWLDADSPAGRVLMRLAPLVAADLPAVVTPGRVLRRATPAQLAAELGLSYRAAVGQVADLAIIGSGPAGLAAAVYGASEGLDTLLLDATGVGGQAAATSRIENYLGFPSGLSGHDLTQRAALQALKFGAQLFSPCRVTAIDTAAGHLRLDLADGNGITTRAILIATGARYRALDLPRWAEFEGAGIYYAATELEARACDAHPVTVVGGANSAGQAALYLASRGSQVTLAIRGPDAAAGMSAYLLDRLQAHPAVTVRVSAEVTVLAGATALEAVTITDSGSLSSVEQPCRGLFCFIGADPATAWLHGVTLDHTGYIRTDVQLDPAQLDPTWTALGRRPLAFETSMPAVFAAGDVRHGSMKRVASAVGEGASAIRSVHSAIGIRF
jgi:thioredoxin reductase (NADPH)